MYEDRTQNNDQEIHDRAYMIHPFPCHIIYSHVQTIAYYYKHNWLYYYTERQWFSLSLKSGLLKIF